MISLKNVFYFLTGIIFLQSSLCASDINNKDLEIDPISSEIMENLQRHRSSSPLDPKFSKDDNGFEYYRINSPLQNLPFKSDKKIVTPRSGLTNSSKTLSKSIDNILFPKKSNLTLGSSSSSIIPPNEKGSSALVNLETVRKAYSEFKENSSINSDPYNFEENYFLRTLNNTDLENFEHYKTLNYIVKNSTSVNYIKDNNNNELFHTFSLYINPNCLTYEEKLYSLFNAINQSADLTYEQSVKKALSSGFLSSEKVTSLLKTMTFLEDPGLYIEVRNTPLNSLTKKRGSINGTGAPGAFKMSLKQATEPTFFSLPEEILKQEQKRRSSTDYSSGQRRQSIDYSSNQTSPKTVYSATSPSASTWNDCPFQRRRSSLSGSNSSLLLPCSPLALSSTSLIPEIPEELNSFSLDKPSPTEQLATQFLGDLTMADE